MEIKQENVTIPQELEANEYYALMVTDYNKSRNRRDFLDYDKVFFNQRCGGYAPNWHSYFVLGEEVFVPDDASLCCIETVQMSHSAERVSPIAVNSNRSARAVTIADAFVHAFVGA